MKNEDLSTNRKGKREYLNDSQTRDLIKGLNRYFQIRVRIPSVRMGEQQEIETLSEEALLLAMYLRSERTEWNVRVVVLSQNDFSNQRARAIDLVSLM